MASALPRHLPCINSKSLAFIFVARTSTLGHSPLPTCPRLCRPSVFKFPHGIRSSTTRISAIHPSLGLLSKNLLHTLSAPVLRENFQFLYAFVPASLALLGCTWLRIGMEKDISVAIVRSSIQLLCLAFALKFVFEGERIMALLLAITFMVLIAGYTAGERAKNLPSSHRIATLSLAVGALLVLGLMVALKALPLTPRFFIPTAGYVIGNSMSMVGATLNELNRDIRNNKGQIEAALSLGASPQQAVRKYIQHALLQGMEPWNDSIKTAGLITIPGAMTGMLVEGVHPLKVVQMQLQLVYMLLGSAALSSAISTHLGWQALFSKSHQLLLEELVLQ